MRRLGQIAHIAWSVVYVMVNGDGNETQCTVHTVTEKRDASVGCRRAVRYGVREIVERANRLHATGTPVSILVGVHWSQVVVRRAGAPPPSLPPAWSTAHERADRDGARDTRTLMKCECEKIKIR